MDPRYLTIRRKLDHLGYKQQFDLGSLPLIEKLLNDLVQQNTQLKSIDPSPIPCKACAHALTLPKPPYDFNDYRKLIKENNDLSRRIGKIKDDCDRDLKALSNQLRKLENQNEDLVFLNNQYLLKIQNLEKESKQKSDKLHALQEKNLHAVIQTSGPKKNFTFQHQRLEIDALVPPSTQQETNVKEQFPYDKLQYADLLKIADDRVNKLKLDLDGLRGENEKSKELVESLRKQVQVTNAENERLSNLLNINLPCRCSVNPSLLHTDHSMVHLNFEVEHLRRLNQDLEKQLKETLNSSREMQTKVSTLTTQNKHLEMELEDVDKVAQALKKQKDELVNTADKEMNDAKNEMEKLCTEIDRLKSELATSRKETEGLSEARDGPYISRGVNTDRRVQREGFDNDLKIKDLEEKLGAAALRERELQIKLDELNKLTISRIPVPESNLQQIVQSLESQRDFYKEKVDELSRSFHEIEQNRDASASTAGMRRTLMDIIELPSSPLMKHLEEERDLYKAEYLKLKDLNKNGKRQEVLEQQSTVHKIRQVMEEKDELSKTLEVLEKHIEELNNSLKDMTKERDMLRELCRKLQAERDAEVSKKSTRDSLGVDHAQGKIVSKADFQAAVMEADDLRNRLQLATETQIGERKRLEKRIIELETDLQIHADEKAELLSKNSSYEVLLTSMQDQIEALQNRITELQNEALQEKTNANKLRVIANQAEKSFKDAQRILTQRSTEQSEGKQRVQDLEMKIAELNQIIDSKDIELNSLKNSLRLLDREKDALQMEVDRKTEQVAALQQELSSKSHEITSAKNEVGTLGTRLERLMEELLERESRCRTLETRLESTKGEILAAMKTRDNALQRIKQLEEDMKVMTRENQDLMQDVQNLQEEREVLKRQIQDYVGEVARVEDLLKNKEQERSELLDQFRTLNSTTSSLESHKSHLETVANNSRMELLAKDSELQHLQDVVAELNLEIQNYFSRQQENNNQIVELQHNLNDVESRLQISEQERNRLQREISSVRELCVKLDLGKTQYADTVKNKDREAQKLEMANSELQQQIDSLKLQLTAAQSEIGNLENLLAANRQKEFLTDIQNRELTDDLNIIKERLRKAEIKLEEQIQTALRYRTRVTELEMEADRLKRQLTNERFERERIYQELKRVRQPTPGSLAEYLDRNQVTSTSDSRRKVVAVEISPIALSLQADVELQDQGRSKTMMEYSQSRTSSNVRAGIAYTPSLVVSPPSDSGLQESLNVGHSPNSGGIESSSSGLSSRTSEGASGRDAEIDAPKVQTGEK